MGERHILKGLETIIAIRNLQKELAQIEVMEMRNEENFRKQERESANKVFESSQSAWKKCLQQNELNPEILTGYSKLLNLSAREYEITKGRHENAILNTKEKIATWRLSDAKTRQSAKLKKKVSQRVQQKLEESKMRLLEERTCFNWRKQND